jgi:integrase
VVEEIEMDTKEVDQKYVRRSSSTSKQKTSIVKVGVDKGWLRLRWTYQAKRYTLTLGLSDSPVNRVYAEQKSKVIELDIVSNNFDPTLKKYNSKSAIQKSQLSFKDLLDKFWADKSKVLSHRSLENYHSAIIYLEKFYKFYDKGLIVQSLTPTLAEEFVFWLKKQNLTDITCKTYLTLISAIWQWSIKKGLVENNPWNNVKSFIKVTPKQMPTPFTKEEIFLIIQSFREDKHYYHYADFVEFLFGSGCRTGEAIGLMWKHASGDCSSLWVGESFSRGIRKTTKTNRARTITLTKRLQEMLLLRRPENFAEDSLIFTSPKGGVIDDHNFRNRAWKTILNRLNIDYRKPYTTRHTLISHALDLGMNPVNVAQLTGHDVQTLYENYAGVVNSRTKLPEIN